MKVSVASLMLIAVATAETSSKTAHPVREEIIDQIAKSGAKWEARPIKDNYLRHIPTEQLSSRLGYLGPSQQSKQIKSFISSVSKASHNMVSYLNKAISGKSHTKLQYWDDDIIRPDWQKDDGYSEEEEAQSEMPWSWDWRTEEPDCIGEIEDQGDCGACWAFASSGMLSDRLCIQTGGAQKVRLSAQELVSCNYENFACDGGYLIPSVDHLLTEGLVSRDCIPYIAQREDCAFSCIDISIEYRKYYCDVGSMQIPTNREAIKKELVENGPMMMGLEIYEDFMNYQSGVYKHVTGEFLGGHAMKLVGYGHDNDEGLYWILQNQWTDGWGDNGFINIKHGQIGIDDLAISCMPDLI